MVKLSGQLVEGYRRRFAAAAQEAVDRGVLLSADAEQAVREAAEVDWTRAD